MTNGRQKGKRGELEFARLCRDEGFDARRTAQYCGNSGEEADVVGLPGVHVEMKRVESLNVEKAMQQAVRDSAKGGQWQKIISEFKEAQQWKQEH